VFDNGFSPTHPDVAAVVGEAVADLVDGAGMKRVEVSLAAPPIDEIGPAVLHADLDPDAAPDMVEVITNLMQTDGAAEIASVAFTAAPLSLEAISRAHVMRHELNSTLASIFDDVDLLLLPTSPVPACGATGPVFSEVAGRHVGPAAAGAFTSMFNLSGHPAVSVPAGFSGGTPVGLQIVARRHDDALALAAAAAFERLRPWPQLAPYARS
jgi:aspartyl-tRNA(Asn)/glutamyl-tRNA(Gln) amidotransferase subunit A